MSRVWPRASAAAERLWTGNVSFAKKNVMERAKKLRCRMVQYGIPAGPLSPGFCPHEVPYPHPYNNNEMLRTIKRKRI
jgi:hypothetical protein